MNAMQRHTMNHRGCRHKGCPRLERMEDRVCLDATAPTITSMAVAPSVVEGQAVTLNVVFDDGRDLNHEVVVSWGDGLSNRLVLTNNERSFALDHTYLDDNPTGTPSDPAKIDVTITAGSLIVGNPAVFVVDISGSTSDQFGGTPVGDLNGDGDPNTILDAEIAGFLALNQRLIDLGLGNIAQVGIVAFSTGADHVDADPVAAGIQVAATPLADTDGDGLRDVEEALRSLQYDAVTNFEAALQKAIETFNDLGAQPGHGTVVFLSDGYPNTGGTFTDEVDTLKTTMGQTVFAFGVGPSSSLVDLQKIDPSAVQFSTTDELLNVFTGGDSGGGSVAGSVSVQVVNLPPSVSAGLDRTAAPGDTVSFIATITDAGAADTHTVAWSVTDAAGGVVANGAGTSFAYQPTTIGDYTITFTATDDDGGVGTSSSRLTVTAQPVDLVAPTLTGFQRFGVHYQPTRLMLSFSESLDPARAQNLANYRLVQCGPDGRFGTRDDRVIRIASVTYHETQKGVILRPAQRLNYYRPYRLTVLGSGETGLTDLAQNRMDGDHDGTSGGDCVMTFIRSGQVVERFAPIAGATTQTPAPTTKLALLGTSKPARKAAG